MGNRLTEHNFSDSNRELDNQVADIKILQKVNAVHREAFTEKFPGQCEHCLRLIMERLLAGLDTRGNVDRSNPDTWRMTATELSDLAQAAYHLNSIRQTLK